jgi:hypothetical protein
LDIGSAWMFSQGAVPLYLEGFGNSGSATKTIEKETVGWTQEPRRPFQ